MPSWGVSSTVELGRRRAQPSETESASPSLPAAVASDGSSASSAPSVTLSSAAAPSNSSAAGGGGGGVPARRRDPEGGGGRANAPADPSATRTTTIPGGSWREWHAAPGPLLGFEDKNADVVSASHARHTYCADLAAAHGGGRAPEWTDDTWRDPGASFQWLMCNTCLPSFVGTECPPGDSFNHSPPSSAWQLLLPEKYIKKWGDPDPDKAPAAQALFRHVRETGCASWRRGVYLPCTPLRTIPHSPALAKHFPHTRFMLAALPPLPPRHPVSGSGLPLCDTTDLAAISRGHVNPQTRLWLPEGCRLPYRWPHELVTQCTAGKRVLVLGDSPVRQWAHRLTAFIRGQPIVVEHEYTVAAAYAFDGSRDEWRPLGGLFEPDGMRVDRQLDGDLRAINLTGVRRGVDLPDGPFYMVRLSDTKLGYWRLVRALMDVFQPTHVVLGSNYWLNETESVGAPQRIARALYKTLSRGGPGVASLDSVTWFRFPCHRYHHDSDPDGVGKVPYQMHQDRDDAVVAALSSMWARHGARGGVTAGIKLHWLPTCPITRAGQSAFGVDTVHLACRWHPFPTLKGNAFPVSQIKATLDYDCSDGTDVTLSRFFLTSLCPHLL